MKPFVLDPSMTSVAGTFYPTGYVFALFADEAATQAAAQALAADGRTDIAYAAPDTILQHVVRTLGKADEPLPSVGAEGALVRRIADMASDGAHALLIKADDEDTPDTLRASLAAQHAEAAFYYRRLIIEDLLPQPVV